MDNISLFIDDNSTDVTFSCFPFFQKLDVTGITKTVESLWPHFKNANLTTTRMGLTSMPFAGLSGSKLFKASLYNAYLEGSDLKNAVYTDASLFDADLDGANLANAKLTSGIWNNTTWLNSHLATS